jgi:hypothetical protein
MNNESTDRQRQVIHLLEREGGVLQFLIMTSSNYEVWEHATITPSILASGRSEETVDLERIGALIFCTLSTLLLIGGLFALLRWRHAPGIRSASLLILPPPRHIATTIFTAMLFPILVYTLYMALPFVQTHLDRHYVNELAKTNWLMMCYCYIIAWFYLFSRYLLAAPILGLALASTESYVRRRSLALGISIPPKHGRFFFVMTLLMPLIMIVSLFRGPRTFGIYKATLARSFIPILASVVLIVSVFSHAYFQVRDYQLAHYAPTMESPDPRIQKLGWLFAPGIEAENRLHAELVDAIAKWQREWPDPRDQGAKR